MLDLMSQTIEELANEAVEIEQALLGSILTAPGGLDDVIGALTPEAFASLTNEQIFRAIVDLSSRGEVNSIAVARHVSNLPECADAGGREYIRALLASTVTTCNNKSYAEQIMDNYRRRLIVSAAREAVHSAAAPGDKSSTDIAREACAQLDAVLDGGNSDTQRSLGECARSQADRWAKISQDGKPDGISTGLNALDAIIGGFQDDSLYLVGGRPSMGKTAFVSTAALSAAREGKKVAIFSLEMSGEQMAARFLSSVAEFSARDANFGRLEAPDLHMIYDGVERLARLGITVDDSESLTPALLRSRSQRLKRTSGLDIVFVDYLGLMDPDTTNVNRAVEVGQITRACKNLSKALKIPVVLLSQLNRSLELRENKRPLMSDLRDSGSIEQDASVVIFLYRDEYYLERAKPEMGPKYYEWMDKLEKSRGVAEFIVSKNRAGPVGTAEVRFIPDKTMFADK